MITQHNNTDPFIPPPPSLKMTNVALFNSALILSKLMDGLCFELLVVIWEFENLYFYPQYHRNLQYLEEFPEMCIIDDKVHIFAILEIGKAHLSLFSTDLC